MYLNLQIMDWIRVQIHKMYGHPRLLHLNWISRLLQHQSSPCTQFEPKVLAFSRNRLDEYSIMNSDLSIETYTNKAHTIGENIPVDVLPWD